MSEHYFTERPSSERDRRQVELRLRGHDVVGVDGGRRLQPRAGRPRHPGALREAPDLPAAGELLDLGCGWGALALAMALDSPDARGLGGRRQQPRAVP